MRIHRALVCCCVSIALCPLLAQSLSDQLDCACATSRATYAEDLALLPTLLRNSPTHRAGTFVEIGALDGFTFSNTLMLERCFGWRGVLIEANPLNFAKLNASGRPSVKVQSAVCEADKDPSVVEFTVDGGPVAGQVGQSVDARASASLVALESRQGHNERLVCSAANHSASGWLR
jgi:hypothetical protein